MLLGLSPRGPFALDLQNVGALQARYGTARAVEGKTVLAPTAALNEDFFCECRTAAKHQAYILVCDTPRSAPQGGIRDLNKFTAEPEKAVVEKVWVFYGRPVAVSIALDSDGSELEQAVAGLLGLPLIKFALSPPDVEPLRKYCARQTIGGAGDVLVLSPKTRLDVDFFRACAQLSQRENKDILVIDLPGPAPSADEQALSLASALAKVSSKDDDATLYRQFVAKLQEGHVSNPDSDVMKRIALSFSARMAAVVHNADWCLDLYYSVKNIPATSTRAVIRDTANIALDGPLSGERDNLLTACDLTTGEMLIVKVITPQERAVSTSRTEALAAVTREIEVAQMGIDGFVCARLVSVHVPHDGGPGRDLQALAMPHYCQSLARVPQLSAHLVARGFDRVRRGLEALHALNFVHMDVKSGKRSFLCLSPLNMTPFWQRT
eukprot:m51a1_g7408 hypothetical protein (436) ;mRNA; r:191981-195383